MIDIIQALPDTYSRYTYVPAARVYTATYQVYIYPGFSYVIACKERFGKLVKKQSFLSIFSLSSFVLPVLYKSAIARVYIA